MKRKVEIKDDKMRVQCFSMEDAELMKKIAKLLFPQAKLTIKTDRKD